MNLDHSQRITDHFRGAVQDWTPAAARHSASVLFAPASFDDEVSEYCSTMLSESELERVEGFLSEDHKKHFIQRRAFRRFCAAVALGSTGTSLSQIIFEETNEGRPYLIDAPETWFSFSSCRRGFLGAWSSTHRLGVDIEDPTQILETSELSENFFSRNEAKMIGEVTDPDRTRSFFHLWNLKESALKSIGEGLPFGLDAFEFDLLPKLRVSRAPSEYGGAGRFVPHLIDRNTTCAALVTRVY
jgi:phosphopantetheinyl transferase